LTTLRFSRRLSAQAGFYLPVVAVLCFLSFFDVPFYQEAGSLLWQVALVDEDEVDRSEAKASQLLLDDNQDSASAVSAFRVVPPRQRLGQFERPSLPQCCTTSSLIIRAPPIL
jgi:hypothetical protein